MRRFAALFFHILVGYLLGKCFVHFGQEKDRCENHKFKGSLDKKTTQHIVYKALSNRKLSELPEVTCEKIEFPL